MVSSRSSKRSCLKPYDEEWLRKMPSIDLWALTCIYIHKHVYMQQSGKERNRERERSQEKSLGVQSCLVTKGWGLSCRNESLGFICIVHAFRGLASWNSIYSFMLVHLFSILYLHSEFAYNISNLIPCFSNIGAIAWVCKGMGTLAYVASILFIWQLGWLLVHTVWTAEQKDDPYLPVT